MNRGVLKGEWLQLRGRIRKQWGKLTKKDLDVIQGDREILIGKLTERYGRTREQIEKEVKAWFKAEKPKKVKA